MFLKDWVSHNATTPSKSWNGDNSAKPHVARKLCIPFNQGHCKFGKSCRFDHRCSFCGKFGHGIFNCMKAASLNFDPKKGKKATNLKAEVIMVKGA